MPYTVDYDALAMAFFGRSDAGEPIRQFVLYLEKYHADFKAMPPPARLRKDHARIAKQATKLAQQIAQLDAIDRADLFLGFSLSTSAPLPPIAGPLRMHGLQFAEFMQDILRQMAASASRRAEAEPAATAGRPERPDPIKAGAEGLAAIWRQQTSKPLSRSTKAGGFGALAQQVLTAPPLAFSPVSVRHAVNQFLASTDAANPR